MRMRSRRQPASLAIVRSAFHRWRPRRWQQRLDALPQRIRQQPVGQGGHGRGDTQPQTGLLTWLADRHHPVMNQPCEILTCGQARLRRWRAADADTVYRVVMESLEHLLPWMGWASGFSRDDAVRFTAQCEQDWESGVAYQYAITTDDVIVGSCGLTRGIEPDGLDIGYWLHPAYTGRGLATTAVAALVRQEFALPDIERVEIVHDAANTASGGIPRRLGFTEIEQRTPAQSPVASGEVGIEVVWRLTRS